MLQVQGKLVEISPQELAFTAVDIQAYAHQVGLKVEASEAEELFNKTQGWVGGICLLLQLVQRQPNVPMAHWLERRESDALLYDYFLREWLSEHPLELKDFLVKTSFLPLIRSDLCQALFHKSMEKPLQLLFSYQLFVYPVEKKGMVYHPSFKHYLQSEFKRQYSLDEQNLFYAQLSSLLREEFCDEATEYAFEAQDYDKVAENLNVFKKPLLQTFRYQTLQNYLEKLPETYRKSHPEWQILLAEVFHLQELCLCFVWWEFYSVARQNIIHN